MINICTCIACIHNIILVSLAWSNVKLYIIISLSPHQFLSTWVVFRSWLSWIVLQWTEGFKYLLEITFWGLRAVDLVSFTGILLCKTGEASTPEAPKLHKLTDAFPEKKLLWISTGNLLFKQKQTPIVPEINNPHASLLSSSPKEHYCQLWASLHGLGKPVL